MQNRRDKDTAKRYDRQVMDWYLWLLLIQTKDIIQKLREKELKECGLSWANNWLLSTVVGSNEQATPSDIARIVLVKPHSVSGLINRMTKSGLVKKMKDLARRNQVRVTLTEKGWQIYNETTRRESIRKVMSALSDDEQVQLIRLLKKISLSAFTEMGEESSDIEAHQSMRGLLK